MTGSFPTNRLIVQLVRVLHLNCPQATVSSQFEQSLIKIDIFTGPMKNLQLVHLSMVIYKIRVKIRNFLCFSYLRHMIMKLDCAICEIFDCEHNTVDLAGHLDKIIFVR